MNPMVLKELIDLLIDKVQSTEGMPLVEDKIVDIISTLSFVSMFFQSSHDLKDKFVV